MGIWLFVIIVGSIAIIVMVLKIIWDVLDCMGYSRTNTLRRQDSQDRDIEMQVIGGAGDGRNTEAGSSQVNELIPSAPINSCMKLPQVHNNEVAIPIPIPMVDRTVDDESVTLEQIEDILSVANTLWKQFQKDKNNSSPSNAKFTKDVILKLLANLYDIKCRGRRNVREARSECANLIILYIRQLEKLEEMSSPLR